MNSDNLLREILKELKELKNNLSEYKCYKCSKKMKYYDAEKVNDNGKINISCIECINKLNEYYKCYKCKIYKYRHNMYKYGCHEKKYDICCNCNNI